MDSNHRSFMSRLGGRLSRRSAEMAIPPNPCHDDIYLVEYPKSGITYLSFLVANIELILSGSHERVTFYNHHRYVADVHQLRGANIRRQTQRTFIKSHSGFNPRYYFVVLLLRNPLDVMVSYYNFMVDQGYVADFESFVKDKRYGIEGWKSHLAGWWYKKVDAQRMHFVRYEDLLQNPAKQLEALYRNFGLSIPDKVLNESIELASLENMRASEECYRESNPNYTMAFVGQKSKIPKSEIMSPYIKDYVLKSAGEAIRTFYPEFLQ